MLHQQQDNEPVVTFRVYNDPMLAHIERTRLEDNGIPCFVDDSTMSVYPIYGNTIGGIHLKIFERDRERAESILAEEVSLKVEELTDDEAQVVCPYCGSNNVRYTIGIADDANWLTRAISAVANLFPFDDGDKDWHCFNCGQDFDH